MAAGTSLACVTLPGCVHRPACCLRSLVIAVGWAGPGNAWVARSSSRRASVVLAIGRRRSDAIEHLSRMSLWRFRAGDLCAHVVAVELGVVPYRMSNYLHRACATTRARLGRLVLAPASAGQWPRPPFSTTVFHRKSCGATSGCSSASRQRRRLFFGTSSFDLFTPAPSIARCSLLGPSWGTLSAGRSGARDRDAGQALLRFMAAPSRDLLILPLVVCRR